MLSEEEQDALMASLDDDAEVIDGFEDAMGDKVRVGWLPGAALVGVQGSPGILDTPGLRDRFLGGFMEACRRADGGIPAGLEALLTCNACSDAPAVWLSAYSRVNADRTLAPGHVFRLECDQCAARAEQVAGRGGRTVTFLRLGTAGTPGQEPEALQ